MDLSGQPRGKGRCRRRQERKILRRKGDLLAFVASFDREPEEKACGDVLVERRRARIAGELQQIGASQRIVCHEDVEGTNGRPASRSPGPHGVPCRLERPRHGAPTIALVLFGRRRNGR